MRTLVLQLQRGRCSGPSCPRWASGPWELRPVHFGQQQREGEGQGQACLGGFLSALGRKEGRVATLAWWGCPWLNFIGSQKLGDFLHLASDEKSHTGHPNAKAGPAPLLLAEGNSSRQPCQVTKSCGTSVVGLEL